MNRNKLTYERPKCDLLVVRFEQAVLTGSIQAGKAGANESYNNYDEDF